MFIRPEQKTKRTTQSVKDFSDKIPDKAVRDDFFALMNLRKKITGSEPVMWGTSIIGFEPITVSMAAAMNGIRALPNFFPGNRTSHFM